jgi:hypothetical protein
MIMGKYGAMIGWILVLLYVPYGLSEFSGYGILLANHSAVFPHDHQITEFCQTTV